MISHLSIGASDLDRSRRFYDAALGPLGYTMLDSDAEWLGYGASIPQFYVNSTPVPVPAHDQSGLHICFTAPDRASVDAFHAGAVSSGGTDNGVPGLRPNYGANYYAAFTIDPDGYRVEAWCDSP